jgi:hypothetical protein
MLEAITMMRLLGPACIAITIAAALFAGPRTAAAKPSSCSADSTFNAVEASDVIVGGRITGWTRRDDLIERTTYTPVELHIEVAHAWKGALSPGDVIIDGASLYQPPGQPDVLWAGGGGACGALDHDPTGWYAVFGLRRDESGALRTNRLTTFWLRETPYDLAMFGERGLGLPATGAGSSSRAFPSAVIMMLAAGVVMIVAGGRRGGADGSGGTGQA